MRRTVEASIGKNHEKEHVRGTGEGEVRQKIKET
jgi:hypothetical protein